MECLNKVKKEKEQYVRIPDVDTDIVSFENEARVMNMLGFNARLTSDGDLIRDWVDGEELKSLSEEQQRLLVEEIEKIHALPTKGISSHFWKTYIQHINELTDLQKQRFEILSSKYQDKDLVVSHNDLNFHNILWDGKKIIPIDFEWCNLNHPYFDYVQFFIAQGIKLREDLDKKIWNEILELSLYYFVMWTYEMPQVDAVLKWREDYLDLIRLYINGDI